MRIYTGTINSDFVASYDWMLIVNSSYDLADTVPHSLGCWISNTYYGWCCACISY